MEGIKVNHKDFIKIAKENDYFLWHFLQKNQNDGNLTIRSIEEGNKDSKLHLNILLKEIDIPYFESYTEDSIDFLHELGIPYDKLWNPNFNFILKTNDTKFHPVVIGFKKFEKTITTLEVCYCLDGVLKIIGELNPDLILNHECYRSVLKKNT
jgi:hypothetical protein